MLQRRKPGRWMSPCLGGTSSKPKRSMHPEVFDVNDPMAHSGVDDHGT